MPGYLRRAHSAGIPLVECPASLDEQIGRVWVIWYAHPVSSRACRGIPYTSTAVLFGGILRLRYAPLRMTHAVRSAIPRPLYSSHPITIDIPLLQHQASSDEPLPHSPAASHLVLPPLSSRTCFGISCRWYDLQGDAETSSA